MKKNMTILILIIVFLSCSTSDELSEANQSLYFPSISGSTWETISPSELNWNEAEIEPLFNYLEEKNTKSFIILYNGWIVIEKYFGDHSESKPWYWASAGKTLTSIMTGIAEEKG